MKVFVTEKYMKNALEKITQLQKELENIRREKNISFEGDTNTWHDNFAYENLNRQEKLAEDRLFKAMKDAENFEVCSNIVDGVPDVVGLYCWVRGVQENLETGEETERVFGLAPLGDEDYAKKIFTYNSPAVCSLMGAKVGDERVVKIPVGTFKITILHIEKM